MTRSRPRGDLDSDMDAIASDLNKAVDDLIHRTRTERGLPPTIEDERTIDRVAAILRGVRSLNIWGFK